MSSPLADSEKDNLIRALAKQAESLENAEEFEGFLKVFRLYFKEKPHPRESAES
jgi:hypothetical protein